MGPLGSSLQTVGLLSLAKPYLPFALCHYRQGHRL